MTIFKKLYRRDENFLSDAPERDITGGYNQTFTFDNPGWVAFDFMANVPIKPGQHAKKYLKVEVNGVLRFKTLGGWSWQRYYIFVEAGTQTVRWFTEGYDGGDYAKVRYINLTDFPLVEEPVMLENTSMPRPLESITPYEVSQGWQRYQRSGTQGCELKFTLIFTEIAQWRKFMSTLENFYIISGDYGTYGGVILPQDCNTVREGPLILMECVMLSSMTAGIGVDGE